MYVPAHFNEGRVPVLHEAIRALKFGTLVTLGTDGLEASPIPMLIDPDPGPFGTLRGHVARANRQWERVRADVEALALFVGPHAYVTPQWYAAKREHGKVVPTWNYLAIEARGPVRFIDDPDFLRKHVTALTEFHEAARSEPWAVADAPDEYVRTMLRAIVGFELPIAQLSGKWKMSQNRSEVDRAGVESGLRKQDDPGAQAVATIMLER